MHLQNLNHWTTGCFQQLLNTFQLVCRLHSQENCLLAKPLVYVSVDRRTLSSAAHKIENAIPSRIRNSTSVNSFECYLQTFSLLLFFILTVCHERPVRFLVGIQSGF